MSNVHRQAALRLRTVQRQKSAASSFTNPSLASSSIPTLANPIRGFGSQTNNSVSQTVTEVSPDFPDAQFAQEQLLQLEPIKQHPLSHDISRIPLRRPQTQATVTPKENSDLIIQRDDTPGVTWGDWKIPIPTPKGETDDRYDNPENQRRAERQEEDARSGDPQPQEWWKPQQPQMLPSPGKCPSDRWNWVLNACCPIGKHKDPSGPNCILDQYDLKSPIPPEMPKQLPEQEPSPAAEPGDWNQPDEDIQYA